MRLRYLAVSLLCFVAANAGAQAKRTQAGKSPELRVDFTRETLPNGLNVIYHVDHSTPVAAVLLWYNVGSKMEEPGRTGFAHLFEHMMFQGSKNVAKGQHFSLLEAAGGRGGADINGTTNWDRTAYFETIPSNQVELGLWLESDRMATLLEAMDQAKLDNQREVVKNERRQSFDNQPYGIWVEKMGEAMFPEGHPYHHSVIGSMEDLDAATVEDVREFFRTYYAPNNAVLSIAGDFDSAGTRAMVEKYFTTIPRQPDPPAVDMAEPEQKAERRTSVDDALARLSQVDIAFKTVPGNTADFYALQVLSTALQSGQSSRLYQVLVKDKQLVQSVGGFADEKRGTGAFYTTATVRQGSKTADVEAAIYDEIERIKKDGIADWELQKAKNTTRRNFINNMQSSLSRALNISVWTVYYNDPNLINTRLDKIMAVTKEDVQRVANKYLAATNRTVVITIPKPKAAAAATQQ